MELVPSPEALPMTEVSMPQPVRVARVRLAKRADRAKGVQRECEALREIDFGDWSGLGWQAVEDQFGFSAHEWLEQIHHPGAPNGEDGATFRRRVGPCLRKIIAGHRGENVAIFCHGGVIRLILSVLLKISLPKTTQFDIEYASITQVALHEHMNEVELLNFTPWRDLVA